MRLFSGLFWTGEQAKERGLIDGFASSGELVREQLKLPTVIDYTIKKTLFERFSKNMGTAIAKQISRVFSTFLDKQFSTFL